jgi:hypothetical protein
MLIKLATTQPKYSKRIAINSFENVTKLAANNSNTHSELMAKLRMHCIKRILAAIQFRVISPHTICIPKHHNRLH